jgi:hypothetical protein
MRIPRTISVGFLSLLAASTYAGSVEVAVHVGQAFPFYEQTFVYDPGSTTFNIPGLTSVALRQDGGFELEGSGGSALGGSVTYYLAPSVGLEARLDTAAIDIETRGAQYHVTADLPSPLPDLSTNVSLDGGTFDIERLRPLSLNLKLRTPGRVAFVASGGVSYLPTVRATAEQPIGLGATGFDPATGGFNVATVRFRAAALPEDDDSSRRIGGNAGLGVLVGLGENLSMSLEGRGFLFPKHRLDWQPVLGGPLSFLEQPLLEQIRNRIDAVEFNPTFFQATIGLALRF